MRSATTALAATVLSTTLVACAGSTPATSGGAGSAQEPRDLRGKLAVFGPLSYDEVAEAIAVAHTKDEVMSCYASGGEWMDVVFYVDGRGAAHDVSTSGPLFAPGHTKTCLETLVRATRYPPAKVDERTEVRWSVAYVPIPRGQGLMRGAKGGSWLGLTSCPRQPCADNMANDTPNRAIGTH